MSQFDFGVIDPNVKNGTQLAADLNQWRDAVHSSHAGVARPAYVKPGMLWVEQASAALWNLKLATASGDVLIAGGNPATNLPTPQRAGDGTIAAPGISWLNEPTAGFYRAGAGVFNYGIGGAAIIGLAPNSFSTGAGVNVTFQAALNVGGTVTAAGFTTPGGVVSLPKTPNSCGMWNHGLMATGPGGANNYAQIVLRTRDTIGTEIEPYTWGQNAPGATGGQHWFGGLAGGGALSITGGGYNNGTMGATLMAATSAGATVAGIDMRVLDSTAGNEKCELQFAVRRNGGYNINGDLILGYAAGYSPQLRLQNTYWTAGISMPQALTAQLQIQCATAGYYTAMAFVNQGDANAWILAEVGNNFYFTSHAGTGPVGGWAMQITPVGAVNAGVYTNASDRSLKSNIRALGHTLRDLLRLAPVRYCMKHMEGEHFGLVAQDVREVYPELVSEIIPPDNDGVPSEPVLALNYIGLIAPIIEALRELDARLKTVEA